MFFFILVHFRLMHFGARFEPLEIFWCPGMLSFRYSVQIAQFCDLRYHINNGFEDLEPCFLLS